MPDVLTAKDIMKIAQIGRNKATERKNEVNRYTMSLGIQVISNRTCLTRHFCEVYGFSRAEIERTLQK